MAKKKGLYFTSGIKEKAKKLPSDGFRSMIPKKKGKDWKPNVSI